MPLWGHQCWKDKFQSSLKIGKKLLSEISFLILKYWWRQANLTKLRRRKTQITFYWIRSGDRQNRLHTISIILRTIKNHRKRWSKVTDSWKMWLWAQSSSWESMKIKSWQWIEKGDKKGLVLLYSGCSPAKCRPAWTFDWSLKIENEIIVRLVLPVINSKRK